MSAILHDYARKLYSHATMTADPSAGDAHLDDTQPPVRGERLCFTASPRLLAAATGAQLAAATGAQLATASKVPLGAASNVPLGAASGVRR